MNPMSPYVSLGWGFNHGGVRVGMLTVGAHFDGEHIVLDLPLKLTPQMRLVVQIVSPTSDSEQDDLLSLAETGLKRAYGDNEPEYTIEDVLP